MCWVECKSVCNLGLGGEQVNLDGSLLLLLLPAFFLPAYLLPARASAWIKDGRLASCSGQNSLEPFRF